MDSQLATAIDTIMLHCDYTPPYVPTSVEDQQAILMEANAYLVNAIRLGNVGFPEGYWYMATLTSMPDDTVEELYKNYEKVLEYFQGQVVHAVHEKSSIHHIHFILRLKNIKHKNVNRDVTRMCQRRFVVEKVANALRKYRGLCKYVLKREYQEDKASTFIKTLKEGVKHSDEKGYYLV